MRYTYNTKLLIIAFLACLFLLGVASDVCVLNYYHKGEPLNEEWQPELGRQNETDYASVFFGRDFFINLNGGMRRLLGQREMNGVLRLDNDHLTQIKSEPVDDAVLKKEAANVSVLYRHLQGRGIPFLFVLPPDKVVSDDPTADQIPAGYTDYSNRDIDVFMQALYDAGTPALDLRQEMAKDGMDRYEYFYKTDHHWTSQAGFYAYTKIADWLKENTDVPTDERIAEESSYDKTEYKNSLLGTWGQRTGSVFAGSDDLTVYTPKFDTDVENRTFSKRGSFADVVYNLDFIEERKPEFIYDAVFDSTDQFTNYSSKNETSVLVICDSFGRVVNPYLILGNRYFWYKSIYHSNEINGTLIDSVQPDVVIMLFSPWYNLGKEESFSFDLPGVG
ncbi:MAG: hypothetical protein K6E84_01435 [Lachnospiraceae bacterium]|nr:hypothetical protein [Lachnospiraceae bacterium]